MKKILLWLAVALAGTAPLAANAGVSIEVSQPGVFGRIDIGRFPQPRVVLPRPIIIQPPAVIAVQPEPVYLWVPPGHRKDWRKHCGKYNACGHPVYFVRHDWYDQHVMPEKRRGDDGHGRGKGHDHGKGKGRD